MRLFFPLALLLSSVPCHAQAKPAKAIKKTARILTADPKITMNGLGFIRIGLPIRELERMLGTKLEYFGEQEGPELVEAKSHPGLQFYIEKGRVAFIEVRTPSYKTEKGVAVGQDVASIVRNFDSIEINSTRYDPEARDVWAKPQQPDHYDEIRMNIRPEFKGMMMRFYLDSNQKIVFIRVGVADAVSLDEIH